MQRTPPFPFLPDLETPLRDAMRGVTNFAEATEDALEPAAQLLPEPLRVGFQRAIRSIETTGKQLIGGPIRHDQIMEAGAFACAHVRGPAEARNFARVVSFAWEHLQHATNGPRFMISETILASKSAQMSAPDSAGGAAAGLLEMIRTSSAIGRMPGIADGLTAQDRKHIDLALVAILVWLLAARADTLEQDVSLLELAMALVRAIQSDVETAMDDPARLGEILQNASAHL